MCVCVCTYLSVKMFFLIIIIAVNPLTIAVCCSRGVRHTSNRLPVTLQRCVSNAEFGIDTTSTLWAHHYVYRGRSGDWQMNYNALAWPSVIIYLRLQRKQESSELVVSQNTISYSRLIWVYCVKEGCSLRLWCFDCCAFCFGWIPRQP